MKNYATLIGSQRSINQLGCNPQRNYILEVLQTTHSISRTAAATIFRLPPLGREGWRGGRRRSRVDRRFLNFTLYS
jgi:hypothetical protein